MGTNIDVSDHFLKINAKGFKWIMSALGDNFFIIICGKNNKCNNKLIEWNQQMYMHTMNMTVEFY